MSSDSDSSQNISKFASRASLIPNEIINQWDNEQKHLQEKIILQDTEEWQKAFNENIHIKQNQGLRVVAGLDLSFIKGNDDIACAGLVVLDVLDNLKIIYEDISMVDLTQPYVPGYLAFREAPCFVNKLNKLKSTRPEIYPQCLFIDGNGILHPKRFGLACHLGVLTDTPSIGIAKKLFQTDGLEKSPEHKMQVKEKLRQNGDYFELRSNNEQNELIGLCYRTAASNPVYVSIGHKVSWKTCVKLLKLISTKYRIPEPIRQADLRTREYLRKKFPSNQDQFKTTANDNDEY